LFGFYNFIVLVGNIYLVLYLTMFIVYNKINGSNSDYPSQGTYQNYRRFVKKFLEIKTAFFFFIFPDVLIFIFYWRRNVDLGLNVVIVVEVYVSRYVLWKYTFINIMSVWFVYCIFNLNELFVLH